MMAPLDTFQQVYELHHSQIHDYSGEITDSEPIFSDIPDDARRHLDSIKFAKSYPKSSLIFVQGQPSKSLYLLTDGKVKLSTCSPVGKVMILQIAGSGDILGLSSAFCGTEHETSAEALETCHVDCIETSEFLKFLRISPEACLIAAKQLSSNYQKAHRQICALGLSDSVFDRVAKLFLSWSGGEKNDAVHVRINNFFTHEEIAGMIGSSRETVTRTLRAFRERDLITVKGREAVIHDRRKLQAAIGTHRGCGSQTDF
jgi:CRP/FNR family transcriptional regulator, cyclic AMP receptor protein